MTRRWFIVVSLVAVGASLATGLLNDGGIYSTRTAVIFTLPGQTVLLPDNGTTDANVIGFAAGVAKEINGGREVPNFAAADAPYYGAGVREGVWVGLPNTGGQWVSSFGRAEVEIQIVGRTAEWVRQSQAQLLAEVAEIAYVQQLDAGIPESEHIVTTVAPLSTSIDHIVSSRSTTIIAFAAMIVAAVMIGGWLSVTADRIVDRRRRNAPGLRARSAAVKVRAA